MPDQATIQRIAKLLARATSPEAAEAQAALEGAFKRMKRDGVSFDDLLTLPKNDLYQDVMIKLVDLILADQPNLSPASRREAYEKYILLIVAKFSGGWDGKRAGEGSGDRQTQQDDDREAAAKAYEQRRQAEEAARGRAQGSSGTSSQSGQHNRQNAGQSGGKEFKSSNSQTLKQENTYTWSWQGKTFSFSPAAFLGAMQPVWGRGSILWCTLHNPVDGLRLFAASTLWGMGFAAVLITLAAVAHALTSTGPLWDVGLKNLFAFLTAIGTLWKARTFWQSGWFRY